MASVVAAGVEESVTAKTNDERCLGFARHDKSGGADDAVERESKPAVSRRDSGTKTEVVGCGNCLFAIPSVSLVTSSGVDMRGMSYSQRDNDKRCLGPSSLRDESVPWRTGLANRLDPQ